MSIVLTKNNELNIPEEIYNHIDNLNIPNVARYFKPWFGHVKLWSDMSNHGNLYKSNGLYNTSKISQWNGESGTVGA